MKRKGKKRSSNEKANKNKEGIKNESEEKKEVGKEIERRGYIEINEN